MTAKRLYFVLIGLCGLLVILTGGGVYFGDKMLAAKAKTIATARADDELVDQKRRIKDDLVKKVSTLSDVNSLAQTFLPDTKNQDALIAEFNAIAKENGVVIDSISFESTATNGPAAPSTIPSQTQALKDIKNVLVLPFSVTAKPVTYEQLITFLRTIETNRRKMQVTTLSITPVTDTKDPNYGKLGLGEFKLEVYLRNEASAPTSTTR